MGRIVTLRSTTTAPGLPADYTAGDEVSNSATAGSVVRPSFDLTGFSGGKVLAAALDLTPASGNAVTTAGDFELLLFKTDDVPTAVGDNVTNPIAAAVKTLAVGTFRFDDTGWTGPLGTVAAGTSQLQKVGAHVVQPLATNVLQYPWPVGFPFEFTQGETESLSAVLRAIAAWDPGGVGTIGQTIGITLDIEVYE